MISSSLTAAPSSTLIVDRNECIHCLGGGLYVVEALGSPSQVDLVGAVFCRNNSAEAGGCMASSEGNISLSGNLVVEGEWKVSRFCCTSC